MREDIRFSRTTATEDMLFREEKGRFYGKVGEKYGEGWKSRHRRTEEREDGREDEEKLHRRKPMGEMTKKTPQTEEKRIRKDLYLHGKERKRK